MPFDETWPYDIAAYLREGLTTPKFRAKARRTPMWELQDGVVTRLRDYRPYPSAPCVEGRIGPAPQKEGGES